jgi:VIT1/CCC1 family predicted Fe2+/Mn2+ transporter
MAASEKEPSVAKVFAGLGRVEEKHARFWEKRLGEAGHPPPALSPSWRARLLIWSAKHWGAEAVLPRVAAMEAAGKDLYAPQHETAGTGMTLEEHEHARVLRALLTDKQGARGSTLGLIEGRHRSVGGNALRAAVLGANDGLCSNLSLVMAVAGAGVSPHTVLLTGFAGLFAGACSMALGEWVSVQSARELAERQMQVERDELEANPEEEREELQLIYEAKGLSVEAAKALAVRLIADPNVALDVLAREELGLDPQELGGSPWVAAGSSFLLFSLGAIVPVVPFLLLGGTTAVGVSVAASGVALFAIGAAISAVTGRSPWISGARQLAFGLGAAGLTYGAGKLTGAALG